MHQQYGEAKEGRGGERLKKVKEGKRGGGDGGGKEEVNGKWINNRVVHEQSKNHISLIKQA